MWCFKYGLVIETELNKQRGPPDTCARIMRGWKRVSQVQWNLHRKWIWKRKISCNGNFGKLIWPSAGAPIRDTRTHTWKKEGYVVNVICYSIITNATLWQDFVINVIKLLRHLPGRCAHHACKPRASGVEICADGPWRSEVPAAGSELGCRMERSCSSDQRVWGKNKKSYQ